MLFNIGIILIRHYCFLTITNVLKINKITIYILISYQELAEGIGPMTPQQPTVRPYNLGLIGFSLKGHGANSIRKKYFLTDERCEVMTSSLFHCRKRLFLFFSYVHALFFKKSLHKLIIGGFIYVCSK